MGRRDAGYDLVIRTDLPEDREQCAVRAWY